MYYARYYLLHSEVPPRQLHGACMLFAAGTFVIWWTYDSFSYMMYSAEGTPRHITKTCTLVVGINAPCYLCNQICSVVLQLCKISPSKLITTWFFLSMDISEKKIKRTPIQRKLDLQRAAPIPKSASHQDQSHFAGNHFEQGELPRRQSQGN